MSKFTRRSALGLAGGVVGLAACAERAADVVAAEIAQAPAYDGEVRFDHGVASGDPLPDRVVLWTRVTPARGGSGPVPVQYLVYEGADRGEIAASGVATTDATRDFTVKVDVGGLSAGADYVFEFKVSSAAGEVASPMGRTKTAAPAGDAPVKLAVISCSNYPFGRFNVYREISAIEGLDAVVHLGDYLYEYGPDGYGGETGQALGRPHIPAREIVSLDDYRARHAQYKSDPDLQAAHAAAPWLCTWDDHESTNNSYRTGAQNHDESEGDWTERKQRAVQAYLEWMPVRDPAPGRAAEAIYRRFDFGDVATIHCLESRLTGRSKEISWFEELAGKAPEEIPMAAMSAIGRVNDPERTMLGQVQEAWLADGFAQSGATWQVLANQVIMARVKPPNFTQTLTEEQIAAQTVGYIQQLIPFSQLGLPWNLDAWDGFPAARERLYAAAKAADARLVTLTGDTHTAWANTLHDGGGERRGVEFACTSVTSPGLGQYVADVPDLGQQFVDANEEIDWYDPTGNGFLLVTLTRDAAQAEYVKVSTIETDQYEAETVARFEAGIDGAGVSSLRKL